MRLLNFPLLMVVSSAVLYGCSSDSPDDDNELEQPGTNVGAVEYAIGSLDPTLFADAALTAPVSIEECTLSEGTTTTCYRIPIAGAPGDDSPVGPYCPSTITASADEGGTWFDGTGTLYDVDGDFILNLASLYNDDRWQMYDPDTGVVTVIDGAEGCEVAGDPNNSSGQDNFCLECSLEALDGGIARVALIPVTPVVQGAATRIERDNVGVALNGVLFGPPAPVDLILSSYTLGLFDDCGGHANPREGYHYHAANGCSEIGEQADDHAPMIGYAVDGYAIFAAEDAAGNSSTSLDECGGESDEARGYHYHASAAGQNEIIGCFMGEQGTIVDL